MSALSEITRYILDAGKYYGAGSAANNVSWASQAAAGKFNQQSADWANQLGTDRLAQMYAYNSAQARMSDLSTWDFFNAQMDYNATEAEKARQFSEYMWNKQANYNTMQAEIARAYQTEMENTRYQRAVADMKEAGINPVLAAGGLQTGAGSPIVASMTGASSAQASAGLPSGAQASGNAMNGISASENNFTGALDYYSGITKMMGSVLDSFSSAYKTIIEMQGETSQSFFKDFFGALQKALPHIGAGGIKEWDPKQGKDYDPRI